MKTYAVGCDGQCGAVLFVDADEEPPQDQTFFCSDSCREWYEAEDAVTGERMTDAEAQEGPRDDG